MAHGDGNHGFLLGWSNLSPVPCQSLQTAPHSVSKEVENMEKTRRKFIAGGALAAAGVLQPQLFSNASASAEEKREKEKKGKERRAICESENLRI